MGTFRLKAKHDTDRNEHPGKPFKHGMDALSIVVMGFCCSTSFLLLFVNGCASIGWSSYSYLAITNDCQCEEYRVKDAGVEYRFRAQYRMSNGMITNVEIEFLNTSNDTLSLDVASVKVSSRNISYQYNDKFVPLPSMFIVPHSSDDVKLSGKETTGENDWHKIAGEQLTVTIKGLRLGLNELATQQVTFVPENPNLTR